MISRERDLGARPLSRVPERRDHGRSTRRHLILLLGAIAASTVVATSCAPATTIEKAPADATQILAAAGFAPPPTEAEVTDGALLGDEYWSRIVTFSGTPEQISSWQHDSFGGDIESRAYRDDEQMAAERLGVGVQKKGDRIASGVDGSVAFIVVVGQEDNPVVHAAVRRTGR